MTKQNQKNFKVFTRKRLLQGIFWNQRVSSKMETAVPILVAVYDIFIVIDYVYEL
ncbi:MAG TPA: hypothetical protein VKA87_05230 [Nitrososphaeraceae archaeon]|nr:hypothetical protein [Nitrososphaeraceae archaeon]